MLTKRNLLIAILLIISSCLLLIAISFTTISGEDSVNRSHGKIAEPDYSLVFPSDSVISITIKIDSCEWNKMSSDLSENMQSSQRGPHPEGGQNGPRPEGGQNRPHPEGEQNRPHPEGGQNGARPEGGQNGTRPEGGQNRPRPEGGQNGPHPGGGAFETGGEEYTPLWGNCSISFNSKVWSSVGIRFKGNSSLQSPFQRGFDKLSFKLDFDKFEDDYPEIKNQRFYGFDQLNLKNNFNDNSFVRESVSAKLLSEFGIPTARTSYCKVYIDYGKGANFFGLYSLVEEIDDTAIKSEFKDDSGNLYKPEGAAATFAENTFNKESMNKKSNKKESNYSDVFDLYNIINSPLQESENSAWREKLNSTFDISMFLKWLAANSVIQNWDTYGNMSHNFYLYNNPSTGKLTWIPWDQNEALSSQTRRGTSNLSMDNIDKQWPLIRYILNDKEWKEEYIEYVQQFSSEIFTPERVTLIYEDNMKLLEPAVREELDSDIKVFIESFDQFKESIEYLKNHVKEREEAVDLFISNLTSGN